MTEILNIGVLVSGSGSNLQAIIDRIEDGTLNARITCVITNNPDAYARERTARHGIPCIVLNHRDFAGREAYDAALVETLGAHDVRLVVLAGFMRIITPVLLGAFPHSVMNIHPALLPAFPGLHAQRQAIEYGVKVSGCTVHFVDEGTDTGPIIIQAAVPVLDNDTEDSLAARIQAEEHRIYPEAIRLFSAGRLMIEGRRVLLVGPPEEKA